MSKPDRCVGCPLYDAPGPVWGHGNVNAKTFWVGEAPGSDEVQYSKRPFTGGSGRILRAIAKAVGINIESGYMSNVVKCRPTARGFGGKLVDRPPTDIEIRHCAPFLGEELANVNPNLVVALGGTALYVFKDTDAISKWRGVPFATASGQKVLAAFHPAHLMRSQHMFPLFHLDLSKVPLEEKTAQLATAPVIYVGEARANVHGRTLHERARRAGYVTIDIETLGPGGTYDGALSPRTGRVDLIGFGTEPHTGECYDWTPEVQRLTTALLEDPALEKIGQNSEQFDWVFLEGSGQPWPVGKTFDTLLAFHLVNPDLPKDLATIASCFTDMPYWKHEAKTGDKRIYNCKDIDATTRSAIGLKRELKLLDMEGLYYDSVMPLQPVLRKMTQRGIKKDTFLAAKWGMTMGDLADQKEAMLRRALGNAFFSVNSPKQLMKLLYEDLGLPVQYTRDKQRGTRPTANDEAMEALAALTNDPVFLEVNAIRSLRKWKATYCEVECDEQDFIHPEFGSAKAANGRLNSWNPNAQNIPHDLRALWVADDQDHILISADWSQVEWQIAMALAGDEAGLAMFTSGQDMHTTIASEVDAIAYSLVSFDQRHAAKFIVYGLGYGRGVKDLAQSLGKSTSWVEGFISRFFRKFHAYKKHRDMQEAFVKQNMFLRNPFNRRRWWYMHGKVTEMYNFMPASTAADMMIKVLPRLERELPKGATLRLTVHDETVTCAHRSVAKQATECIMDIMNQTWPLIVEHSLRPDIVKRYYPNGWYVPADVSFGHNWMECKPKTAEDKLAQKALRKSILGG